MFSRTARRIAAAFAGAALAFSPLALSAAMAPASAAPSKCPYNAPVTTTTTLDISPQSGLHRGEPFTATATVTASVGPAPTGTVTFSYHGKHLNATLTPNSSNSSTASVTFKATSSGAVRAVYQGVCGPNGGGAVIGSSKSGPMVLGVEASRGGNGGGNGNGGSGNVAGTSGSVGGLAATGVTGQTELFGLLGAGMVVVGGLALMVHRRRVQA